MIIKLLRRSHIDYQSAQDLEIGNICVTWSQRPHRKSLLEFSLSLRPNLLLNFFATRFHAKFIIELLKPDDIKDIKYEINTPVLQRFICPQ